MNNETFRYMIDFAAEFGLEYVLIDAGWYGDHRDGDGRHHEADPGARHPRPRGLREAEERPPDRLAQLGDHPRPDGRWRSRSTRSGASPGVKIDYMDRKDQEIVAFYQRAARTAAKYHLTVDFHGAYASSGEERTFPHWLTREGDHGPRVLQVERPRRPRGTT